MWDPGFCQPSPCHNRTSSSSHSENGVPRTKMKASQGSYFPSDSPSSGVIVTGPQVTRCPTTCSCQERVPHLKSNFHAHGDEGIRAAQGGLPVVARPDVASSRLPGVTSVALLVKDQRQPGWALNRQKHLQNLSLQGFLKQNPWSIKTQLENILLNEDSPGKWAPTGCGTVARKWVRGYRVPSSIRVCHRGSDFTTRGPLPGIDSWQPCTQPSGSWTLIPHPHSPGPHSVAPHSPPRSSRAGCVCSSELTDLGPDLPPVSYLFSILDESLSLKACRCPQMPTRDDACMDFLGCRKT